MQQTLTPANSIQAAINSPTVDTILLTPGDYRSQGDIQILRSNLTIEGIGLTIPILRGIEIGWDQANKRSVPVKNLNLSNLLVDRNSGGTGISMDYRLINGRYNQENITIKNCHVKNAGGGFGLIGHNIKCIDCSTSHLNQFVSHDDCDSIRTWGENILVQNFEAYGENNTVGDAHADFIQCWTKGGNADGYLRNLVVKNCRVESGPKDRDRGIHQGIILECYEGQIHTIFIDNCYFENCLSYAIGFIGAQGWVQNCTIVNTPSGKADGAMAHLTHFNTNGMFTRVNGGTVVAAVGPVALPSFALEDTPPVSEPPVEEPPVEEPPVDDNVSLLDLKSELLSLREDVSDISDRLKDLDWYTIESGNISHQKLDNLADKIDTYTEGFRNIFRNVGRELQS